MNDQDKEAFDKWWEEFVKGDLGLNVKAIPDRKIQKAWQVACEYKQKEIDELLKQLKHEHDLYKKHLKVYEDENAKLIECVGFYADEDNHDLRESDFGKRARQVLKELEDK